MHPLTAPIGVTIAALLLLAGCSGQPDSPSTVAPATARATTPSATTSSSPTSMAAATPTPPALPDAATRNDEAGQLAFIEHWWDLYNYAYATGDPGPLMAISDASKSSNSALAADVKRVHSEGRHVEGGGYRVVQTVRLPLDELGVTLPTVTVQRDAGVIVTADGKRESFPAGPPEGIGMALVWDRDHWQMHELGNL